MMNNETSIDPKEFWNVRVNGGLQQIFREIFRDTIDVKS